MLSRPVANPPNPWHSSEIEYLEEEPKGTELQVYEDHSKSILAHNDSPDVGFSWSVNPYRGCQHACAYCLDGDTPILMADGWLRRLRDVRVGDEIYGTAGDGASRRYVRTTVLAHWQVIEAAYRMMLADGTSIVAGANHRFLTRRGWRYVTEQGDRPWLGGDDVLVGVGRSDTASLDSLPAIALPSLRVVSIEPLGGERTLYDITTGTGDFIANGVVSHNCYARPSHEYLGLGAGTDFDTKIVVKPHAAALLRDAFEKPKWRGELVMFSGVTDCYQPLEASYRLTRACLEVCAEYKNPIGIITKAPLVERDIDVLAEIVKVARARVMVSVPFWDTERARAIEPYVATPQRRVRTIERLAKAGIPVGVMTAPIIPGLNDGDMPQVLKVAREAGATRAGWVLLRLPGSVLPVFESRVEAALPLRAERILNRIRETRGGGDKMYDARFGVRGRGEGGYAEMIGALFDQTCRSLGYDEGGGYDKDTMWTLTGPEKAGAAETPKRQPELF